MKFVGQFSEAKSKLIKPYGYEYAREVKLSPNFKDEKTKALKS